MAVFAGSSAGSVVPGDSLLIEHWNGTNWKVTQAAVPDGSSSELRAVTAISPTDLWAVGAYMNTTGRHGEFPLAEHFDGTSWSPVALPTPDSHVEPQLNAVAASSSTDVWAVGTVGGDPLIEHFDGKAWKVVRGAHVGSTFTGVAALSHRNAWMVGSVHLTKRKRSAVLIKHWDGTAWRVAKVPNLRGHEVGLSAVTAISARDVWAVGDYWRNGASQPLTLHWNGSRWKQVLGPALPQGGTLWSVTAAGANDLWAVGAAAGVPHPLVGHWNGHVWRTVPVRTPARSEQPYLWAIGASSPTDVWAVGQDRFGPAPVGLSATWKPLVEHAKGKSLTPSLARPPVYGGLFGIAAVSARDVWAVGSTDGG